MLGHAYYFLGQLDRSEALLEACARGSQQLGDRRDYAWAAQFLGVIKVQKGDFRAGLAQLRESAGILDELGDIFGIASSVFLYSLSITDSQPEVAVRFGACSDALCVGGGFVPPLVYLVEMDRRRSALQELLGGEQFRDLYEQGWRMSIEQAVAELVRAG